MRRFSSYGGNRKRAGFTLLELLLAAAIFSVLFLALYGVFSGAQRLRETTYAAVETGLPKAFIATLLKRDLTSIMPPVGTLAGQFIGEKDEEGSLRVDTLEFFAASAIVSDAQPWGDIQKVEYYLAEAETGMSDGGDFVRAITRNLLPSTEEDPVEERLLHGVQALEFGYYDGEEWQESWDSTTQENEMPEALRMRIEFAAPESGEPAAPPMELLCEVVMEEVAT